MSAYAYALLKTFSPCVTARALRVWAVNRWGNNSVRNLQYSPRIRLVRGTFFSDFEYLLYCDNQGKL